MSADAKFKIEDGIPIPEPQGGSTSSGHGLKGALTAMTVGQSLYVAKKQTSVSAAGQAVHKSNPKRKFATRREDGGTRIWRIA